MSPEKKKARRIDLFDNLFAISQPELRKLAFYLKRLDGSVTLNVTALVNETYLKLREAAPALESPLHLRRMAGKAMRQILADAARRRAAQKRGGEIEFVEWDENMEQFARDDEQLLALDAALHELASLDERQADMVECHFFGGMSWVDVAESQQVSIATVEREWRFIRSWLADAVHRNR